MFIEKIEIPAFRVLRDVVLEFDRSYRPTIFPLGSENGGGKSTLLQLIFVLLHCSTEPKRHVYLKNLLASDSFANGEDERLIARLSVRMGEETHRLEFLSLHNRFLAKHNLNDLAHGFATEVRLGRQKQELETATKQSERRAIATYTAECAALTEDMERIQALMVALNYNYITTYAHSASSNDDRRAVVCRTVGQSASKTEELLQTAVAQVFLLGPSNQQYLFLGKNIRKALQSKAFGLSRPQFEYLTRLEKAEAAMEGFIAYDWLTIDPLVRLFLKARDEDFQHMVATGQYGDRYKILQQEVNGLLLGKTVRPLVNNASDVVGIEFTVTNATGTETVVGTEDLSQGELKRLMIYAWLRANHAKDSLVLIDEIESSFHPDWQVGIVRDLDSWAPSNQYILATHSYELCQALTPSHVRVLAPPLKPREGDELKVPGRDDG